MFCLFELADHSKVSLGMHLLTESCREILPCLIVKKELLKDSSFFKNCG